MPSLVPVGGIRISVTTTSGICSPTTASSSGRSDATPTSSKSSFAATSREMPSRRRTWSSASATLIVVIWRHPDLSHRAVMVARCPVVRQAPPDIAGDPVAPGSAFGRNSRLPDAGPARRIGARTPRIGTRTPRRRVLDQRQHPAGHEPGRPHDRAPPGQLADLDKPAPDDDLDAAPGPGRRHLVVPCLAAGIDHDLDTVALHRRPPGVRAWLQLMAESYPGRRDAMRPRGQFGAREVPGRCRERQEPGTAGTGNGRNRERQEPGTAGTGNGRNRERQEPGTAGTGNGRNRERQEPGKAGDWKGRSRERQEPGMAGAWNGRSLEWQEPGMAGAWNGRSLEWQEAGMAGAWRGTGRPRLLS